MAFSEWRVIRPKVPRFRLRDQHNFRMRRHPGLITLTAVSLSLDALACWTPDYTARLPGANHRAAASALSSGRVLKAIATPGAAL